MATQEQASPSTSTPDATAAGDIASRLDGEIRRHEALRLALAPHSTTPGQREQLLLDVRRELQRAVPEEEVAKNAARYLWWRTQWAADTDEAMDVLNDTVSHASTPEEIDAAIDSAMSPLGRNQEKP